MLLPDATPEEVRSGQVDIRRVRSAGGVSHFTAYYDRWFPCVWGWLRRRCGEEESTRRLTERVFFIACMERWDSQIESITDQAARLLAVCRESLREE